MGIQKFRKRPVEIEAQQWDHADLKRATEIRDWVGDHAIVRLSHKVAGESRYVLDIETLEGVMTAGHKDWIIRGVQGEFYPCKPDIFTQTYEAV